jgi:hypothetical protein
MCPLTSDHAQTSRVGIYTLSHSEAMEPCDAGEEERSIPAMEESLGSPSFPRISGHASALRVGIIIP